MAGSEVIVLPSLPSTLPSTGMARAKTWMMTINNPGDPPEIFLERIKTWESLVYCVFQEERGENGTLHYQGYCEFDKEYRLAGLKRLHPQAHWDKRRGSQAQAKAYCTKEDTRVRGPFEYGDPLPGQGTRSDLGAAIETMRQHGIKRAREDHPTTFAKYARGLRDLCLHDNNKFERIQRTVILLFGPSGCGKTFSFVRDEPDGCCIPVNDGFWFDGYENHSSVLLDEFSGRASKWSLIQCKRVIDSYTVNVPVKGSFVSWRPTKIYVTTNSHPKDWYDYSERGDEYIQIVRRISEVRWWKSIQQETPIIIKRPTDYPKQTSEDWTHFFFPPSLRGGYFDQNRGEFVVENSRDPYNF